MSGYRLACAMGVGLALGLGSGVASAVQIDFTGGTVTMNDLTTGTTNNSVVFDNVMKYEEDGFRLELTFSGSPTAFASIVGDYYSTGNDVIHTHWASGPFGEVTEVRVSRIDGALFDLGGFRVSTNTGCGGCAADGGEKVWVNSSKSSNIFSIIPDDWGLGAGPDPLITIASSNTLFDDIEWFSFTNDPLSTAVGLGLDNFFLDEEGDPDGTDPTTVPEPTSLALLGLGLVALYRRRRRV